MAQELKQTSVNTFVKGLITEASPLTYPENSSVDELNCSLSRTGVRSRRKGLEHETGFSLSSFTFTPGTLVHSLSWENISEVSGAEFLVVQVGSILYFYDKSDVPVSGSEKSFSVNLNTFTAGNGKATAEFRISGTSINGNLVVVSEAIESFYITYDADADSISTTKINPKVRDFDWQGDTAEYADNISVGLVTDIRKYDTYNSGWIDEDDAGRDVLFGSDEGLVTRENIWPRLTHPWFIGKLQGGKFLKGDWRKAYEGNTLIGNGHFILDLYNKDRAAAASVPGLTTEVDNTRFSAVNSFAGRAWFSGLKSAKNSSRVFFSPTIENMEQIGRFYQEADPTAETISDLIDSDGGVVNIPNASNIISLFEMGSSLLVFAENGVWEIKGVDGVFKASEFAVSRIQEADGITNSASLVDAEGTPYWWSKTGVFTITGNPDATQATGKVGSNISLTTVQTFWEAIPGEIRNEAIGNYDDVNNRIFWLYAPDTTVAYKFTKALILDTILGAFIPWEFADAEAVAEQLLHNKDWDTVGATAQIIDTDLGTGVWAFNRGTVTNPHAPAFGGSGNTIHLFSTDTDGTLIESESGRMGVYVDVESEGFDSTTLYTWRKNGPVGGIIGPAKWKMYAYQADSGGTASTAEQELTFMPPDATNITQIWDSGTFETFPGSFPSGVTAPFIGKYLSYVVVGGNINEGWIEVYEENFFLTIEATSYPVGMSFFSGLGGSTVTSNVTSNSGVDNVTSNSGADNVVISQFISTTVGETEMKFLVRDESGSLTVAGLTNTDFKDWGTISYSSYAEAGYDFDDDMTLNKHGVYVTCYFDVTETGFDVDEVTHLNPSSCIMKAFWDLKSTENSSQEAYRFRIPVVVNTLDLTEFNYPYESVVSRNRIRGRGRNLKLRFESSIGKDFQLQGYEVINAKNRGL